MEPFVIKRVGISQKDVATLDKLLNHRSVSEKAQPKDYRNKLSSNLGL